MFAKFFLADLWRAGILLTSLALAILLLRLATVRCNRMILTSRNARAMSAVALHRWRNDFCELSGVFLISLVLLGCCNDGYMAVRVARC